MRALLFILMLMMTGQASAATQKAYFAGGCYWCMEAAFDSLTGVSDAVSGHMMLPDGRKPTEVVEVNYDPAVITYEKLLEIYWLNIDPDDQGGQFYDRGDGYRTAIFTQNDAEKTAATASKAAKEKQLGRTLAPLIVPAGTFEPVETSQQNFAKTNAEYYQRYKHASGRPEKLRRVWGAAPSSGKEP